MNLATICIYKYTISVLQSCHKYQLFALTFLTYFHKKKINRTRQLGYPQKVFLIRFLIKNIGNTGKLSNFLYTLIYQDSKQNGKSRKLLKNNKLYQENNVNNNDLSVTSVATGSNSGSGVHQERKRYVCIVMH